MTTLELAEAIARAVLKEVDFDEMALDDHENYFYANREVGSDGQECQRAVLKVLRDNQSWFCRVSEDEKGCTVDVPYEQTELFPR